MKDVFNILEQYAQNATLVRSSRHAAAITYKGMILGLGVNSLKTHPLMKIFGRNEDSIFLHAEIAALINAINQYGTDLLPKSTLHVLRLTKSGNIGCSKPCSGCERAIQAFKIKKVVHT